MTSSLLQRPLLAGFLLGVATTPGTFAEEPRPGAPAAVNGLHAPADLAIDLVLQAPTVANPVFLNFDARGRMWVVQYRQYPDPAGLTSVSRDEFWRTVYDRKKPAPPYDTPDKAAFRGRDRITIHEDVDGDGTFAKTTTFIDGLNITTAVCRGRGGVWVLTPPHLVFYPDANNDDVPDGPPVVHLEGFGLEDTHSMANSLRWGPDGWLYAAMGSTVTADIVRPGLGPEPPVHIVGQCIWRYQPESRRFEVYAEGGGNAFSCEIDSQGRVFSGHNGGNARGFHYVQGGYLLKGFEKHGELSNPFAFGYFPPMQHPRQKRFSHAFVIYEGNALPPSYRGKLIAVDPLNNCVPLTEITPRGATFATHDIGNVILSDDPRFRPVDIKHGPDGALYVADWFDATIGHNEEGKSVAPHGRIFRVRAAGTKPGVAPFDLSKKPSRELVDLLRSDNRWTREQALQVLGERRDPSLVAPLRAALGERNASFTPVTGETATMKVAPPTGQFALEALWALNLSGGFDEPTARALFAHVNPYVRLWSVRLLGDAGAVTAETGQALAALAAGEVNVEVRSQLAASAKRFPADTALPIVSGLLTHDADASDPYLPLQIWWALESKCQKDRTAVLQMFEPALWQRPLVQQHVAARLMRRFAAASTPGDLLTCAALLNAAPDDATRRKLMDGFEQAFEGRVLPALPDALVKAMTKAGGGSLALRLRQNDPAALADALRVMADPQKPEVERLRLISVLGEIPQLPAASVLGQLINDPNARVRQAVLGSTAAYDDPGLTRKILTAYPQLSATEREIAQSVLTSRMSSATALLDDIDAGAIDRRAIRPESREKMRLLAGGQLVARLDRTFGPANSPQPDRVPQEMARVLAVVTANPGNRDPYRGRVLFEQSCGACHRLHGRGGEIGPDLTSYKRDDLAAMVRNIVNPDAEIREGYEAFSLTSTDGAVYSGFLVAQDPQRVVLRDMTGVNVTLPREKVGTLKAVGHSLMPEGLLSGQSDDQLRDLFAYLRTSQPLVGKGL